MSSNTYKKVLWTGLAALLIFMPMARGVVKTWSLTPVLLVIYSLLFIRLPRLRRAAPDMLVLAFLALAVVSFIFSIYKHDSLYALLRLFAYGAVYYLIVDNFDEAMTRRLLGLVVCIGAGLSIYGLLQYFDIFNHSWWYPSQFLSATYVNHNHFAGFLELVIPVAIGFLASCPPERFYRSLGLGAIVAVLLVAFALTQSRAGWVSLGVSLLFMAVVLIKKTKGARKHLFVLFLIGMVIFGFLAIQKEVLYKRVKQTAALVQGEKEASFGSRLKIWQAALQMVRDRPLTGVGIGDFDWGLYRFRPIGFEERARFAHNDYLHMAAEMGFLAPLIMVLLFAMVIAKGFAQSPDFMILGCAIGVLSLSLHAWVDFNFHMPANMLLFTIYMALIRKDHA